MGDAGAPHALDWIADPTLRLDGAARLARACGAEALLVFAADPTREGKLVPAPGFSPAAGGAGWRDLLARCSEPGRHVGRVAHPTPDRVADAVALARRGIAFVGIAVEADALDATLRPLEPALELIGRLLGAEIEATGLRADLAVAEVAAARGVELARALDEARSQAEAATRVKDDFLAMLGHELRNPLAPIVTALHLVRLRGGAAKEHDVIERQVMHLMRLVDDLLDVSRITRGKVELRRELVEVSHVVNRALEMARPLILAKRQTLVVRVPDEGLVVDGDPARLAQVVSNLVTNAAKYSDDGTTVTVEARADGGEIELAVSDRGIGIAPELLAGMFDQFVQAPQGLDRARGGLGLGLAIVRSLVELHGGRVEAFSDGEGRGSRFVVRLPRARADARRAPPATRAASPSALQLAAAVRVLIVDDNLDAAELLEMALGAAGFVTRCAASAREALAQLDDFDADAALLDIGLPDLDGFELARRVRARKPRIALVALTGYGQAADRTRARDAGFDEHLVKPVAVDAVCATLASILPRP